jgi:sec-independent protein translocase protein TatB
MLDIGWTELFVVGIVALIVIGPKDLPGALHTFGKYVGQLRRMVRQFQDGIDDIARQEDLRELQKTVSDATNPRAIDRYLNRDVDSPSKPAKSGTSDSSQAKEIASAEPSAAAEGDLPPETNPSSTTKTS